MIPFLVLSPGGFIDRYGMEITVKSFADLFHNVTPKHQRRLRLTLIEEQDKIPCLQKLLREESILNAVNIIDREDTDQAEAAYRNAALFFYPSVKPSFKIIEEALSFGLPVLSFESPDNKIFLDKSCSILLQKKINTRPHLAFSKMLEIVYFDPEVKKILSKGALSKYEEEFQWGAAKKKAS